MTAQKRVIAARRAAIVVVIGALAACSGGGATPASSELPSAAGSPSASPSAAPPASESAAADFVVGGERRVVVHVPDAFDPTAETPLVIMLHGFGSSGAYHESYFRLRPTAAERGVLYAYPDGTEDADGNRFWNATDACCDFGRIGVDDVGYLAGLVEEIGTVAAVDPDRVYFIGHSNGGFMSYRMACERADLAAAIVSLAGASFVTPSNCSPTEPVAVLQIHGAADDTVLFEGGTLTDVGAPGDFPPYPSVASTLASWAGYDGCAGELKKQTDLVDVDGQIDGPAGPAESTVGRAGECAPGGHVELWTIPDGGHSPIPSPTFADEVLGFLLEHPKP